MYVKHITAAIFLTIYAISTVIAEDVALSILSSVDASFIPNSINFKMEIKTVDEDQSSQAYTIFGASKVFDGINRTLVYFDSPNKVSGRRMLMDGNSVFMLFPNTSNPVRLTPLQVLLGDASNGDVARTAFSLNYSVKSLTSITVNEEPSWDFQLQIRPEKKGYTYPSARLVVSKKTLSPIFCEFYAESGKMLKKVAYEDYRTVSGKQFAYMLKIIDPENEGVTTTLRYLTVGDLKIHDNRFKKDFLAKMSAVDFK